MHSLAGPRSSQTLPALPRSVTSDFGIRLRYTTLNVLTITSSNSQAEFQPRILAVARRARLVVPHICTAALDSQLCTLACTSACKNMFRIVHTLPCTLSHISVLRTHVYRFATLTMHSIRGRIAFDKKIGICGRLSIRYRCVPSHLVSLPHNAVSCAHNSCSTCTPSVL